MPVEAVCSMPQSGRSNYSVLTVVTRRVTFPQIRSFIYEAALINIQVNIYAVKSRRGCQPQTSLST